LTLIRRTVASVAVAALVAGVAASFFREEFDPDHRWQRLDHVVGLPFMGLRADNSDRSFWIAVAASFAAWACLFFVVMPGLAAVLRWTTAIVRWTKAVLPEKSFRGLFVRLAVAAILLGGIVLAGRRVIELIATDGNLYARPAKYFPHDYMISGVVYIFNETGRDLSVKLVLDGRPLGEVSVPTSRDPQVVDSWGPGPYSATRGFKYDKRSRRLEVEETRPEIRRFTFSLQRFQGGGGFVIRVSPGKANLSFGLPS
jgi:hypothetical protein